MFFPTPVGLSSCVGSYSSLPGLYFPPVMEKVAHSFILLYICIKGNQTAFILYKLNQTIFKTFRVIYCFVYRIVSNRAHVLKEDEE